MCFYNETLATAAAHSFAFNHWQDTIEATFGPNDKLENIILLMVLSLQMLSPDFVMVILESFSKLPLIHAIRDEGMERQRFGRISGTRAN